jgi:apolipoprotein N-acyltransferase
MRRWVETYREELVTGIIGGLLMALSFPPFATRVFSCIALVPLFRYFLVGAGRKTGTRQRGDRTGGAARRGFVLGYAAGFAFFMMLLYWIANLIPASSARMPWLMVPALVLLVLYLSCYPALAMLALALLKQRRGVGALAAAPALWSLMELARSRGELGFSGGIISNALARYPVAIQGLSFYGPFGLSFVLVSANLLAAAALFGRSKGGRLWALVLLVVLVSGHLAWGRWEMNRIEGDRKELGTTIAVVQPNMDLAFKWQKAYRDSVFGQIDRLTRDAAGRGAGLVVFPETAAPVSFRFSSLYRERLRVTAIKAGAELLIGHIDHETRDDEWSSFNSASLFEADGTIRATYGKVNLLPFGERIPFSQYLPILSRLDFGQANFLPGAEAIIFDSDAGRFGVMICFESTFSHFARTYVRGGADFLVNITNDGWFGSRRGPLQHAETAILRAVENRVPIYRAANTGVSMIVDPTGIVRERIGLDLPGIILNRGYRAGHPSFYTRYGHLVFYVAALGSLAVPFAAGIFRRPTRRA